MDHGLVVLETDENGRELLTEAGEFAAGTGAELDVLLLISSEEHAEKQEALDAAGREEHTSFDAGAVLDRVKQDAADVAEEVFEAADVDADWSAIGARVGDDESEADRILAVAERTDADHLFVPGRRRSPTGKVVFGDRTQSILLNFDGPVTTQLE